MPTTYLIVPAWSDQASQCRIVSRQGKFPDALRSYREAPENWAEAGLMNSHGKLVCLSATADVVQEFKDCEPLHGGFVLEVAETADST